MTSIHHHSLAANSHTASGRKQAVRLALFAFFGQMGLLGCGEHSDAPAEPTSDTEETLDDASERRTAPATAVLADYAEPGAYRVGFRLLTTPTSDSAVKVWYPTLDDGNDAIEYEVEFKADHYGAETGTILGHALRNASVASASEPFPVVVFSHGFSLNPEWYSDVTEHLASRGFVVLAPEHDESDWDATVVQATFERPAKVSSTIDLAEEINASHGAFEQALDLQRLAVVGHSYGGYTALATAGARFDVEGLRERCSGLDAMDPKTFLCQPFVSDEEAMDQLLAASEDQTSPLADERVQAIVTVAGDALLFGEAGLSSVSIPTLAVGGTGDNWSPWDWGAELTYSSVASERVALAGLDGADHMIAVNTCDVLPWTGALPEEFSSVLCQDPAWDRADALRVVRSFVTAFLLDTLTGDTTARKRLSSDAVQEAGIQYEASW